MDAGTESCDQYMAASARIENDLLCNTKKSRRLLDIFGTASFAAVHSFL